MKQMIWLIDFAVQKQQKQQMHLKYKMSQMQLICLIDSWIWFQTIVNQKFIRKLVDELDLTVALKIVVLIEIQFDRM